jgi:hypothetical protein
VLHQKTAPRKFGALFLQHGLVDVVCRSSSDRVTGLREACKGEGVIDWQQFHVLREGFPSAGIVLRAGRAIGVDYAGLESHGGRCANVL